MKRTFDPYLAAIVVLAAFGGGVLVVQARNWALMTDELLYTEMARNIAASGLPLPQVRGELIHVNQVLFPLLIAPLAGLLSAPDAYPWIASFNATVMATAAIPVYLVTHFASGSRVAARWVAACSVSLPWLSLASKTLPDALAYTTLMWALYAIARTAGGRRAGWRGNLAGDAVVLLAIFATYAVRNQFIVLLGVWFAVVGLSRVAVAFDAAVPGAVSNWAQTARTTLRGVWRAVWRTPIERPLPTFSLLIAYSITRLEPTWIIGIYKATTTGARGQVAPDGLLGSMLDHVGVIGVGIAGLPLVFGLAWLVSALARVRDRRENDVAITLAVATLVLLFVGASFNLRFGQEQVLERYVFYIAPLILVAAGCFFVKPPKNLALFAIPAIVGVLLLGANDPFGHSGSFNVVVNHVFSPSQIGIVVLQDVADAVGFSIYTLLLTVSIIVGTAAWILISNGRSMLALNLSFALILGTLLVMTTYTLPKIVDRQNVAVENLLGERSDTEKTWVDDAVCDGCTAAMFTTPIADVSHVIAERRRQSGSSVKLPSASRYERLGLSRDLEFWNRSIDSYYLEPYVIEAGFSPTFGPFHNLNRDWDSGEFTLAPDDDSQFLVLSVRNPLFQPQAAPGTRPLAQPSGFTLYEIGDKPKLAWATRGLTRLGWVPPNGATLRVYAPIGATKTTTLPVRLDVASTKGDAGLRGFYVEGTDTRAVIRDGQGRFRWRARVPADGYAEFGLRWRGEKGDSRNAHVEQIVVTAPRAGS